ncbi:MAG: SiaB family protein kinase [Aurantibacter sp.]
MIFATKLLKFPPNQGVFMRFKFDLLKMMAAEEIILAYQGVFDPETTKSVLTMAERNIESLKEEDPSIKRKVFNVMVECIQNIVKHSEPVQDQMKVPIFMVGKNQEKYVISSGNPVQNLAIKELTGKIEKINQLDRSGLKELYKQVMRDHHISEKGGAGLGLIDMARKSGENLSYHFEKINDQLSYFSIKVSISTR